MKQKTVLMLTCLSAGAFASDNIVDIEAIKAGMKYEVYGKIALQAHVRDYENSPNLEGFQTNNESRIGFRGSKQFAKFKPLFIWQIESGYVDPSYKNHEASGGLGERDTFVGFEDWDSFGQIRLGRVLTPMYEIVDWPGANPGMGDVWDWGGLIGGAKFQDRSSNTVRWDSPEWGGLSVDLGYGRTKAAAVGNDQGWWQGGAAHYKVGPFLVSGAYELNRNTKETLSYEKPGTTEKKVSDSRIWDNNTYLASLQGWFDNGISFFTQYRWQDASVTSGIDTGRKEKQNALSSAIMYDIADWQFKLGYAKNEELHVNGKKLAGTDDDVISFQAMYYVDPTAVLYFRARDVRMGDNKVPVRGGQDVAYRRWKSDSFNEVSVGVEYVF
ncbi:porin [Vibrio wakamikoensis]|uniref:Porin n=1 Tax=Vibrio chaetopteri TaxID=3016528 RepID=A0AAU8BGM2_9VIBR